MLSERSSRLPVLATVPSTTTVGPVVVVTTVGRTPLIEMAAKRSARSGRSLPRSPSGPCDTSVCGDAVVGGDPVPGAAATCALTRPGPTSRLASAITAAVSPTARRIRSAL